MYLSRGKIYSIPVRSQDTRIGKGAIIRVDETSFLFSQEDMKNLEKMLEEAQSFRNTFNYHDYITNADVQGSISNKICKIADIPMDYSDLYDLVIDVNSRNTSRSDIEPIPDYSNLVASLKSKAYIGVLMRNGKIIFNYNDKQDFGRIIEAHRMTKVWNHPERKLGELPLN